MTIRRSVSTVVMAALLAGLIPTGAFAATPGQSRDTRSGGLRAAIDRAATRAVADHQLTPNPRAGQNGVRMQGSGGGHVALVVTLVSAVAGAAGTYYMIKEMKKATNQAASSK